MLHWCKAFRPWRFGSDSIAWRILQSEDNYRFPVSFAYWMCIHLNVLVVGADDHHHCNTSAEQTQVCVPTIVLE